jgi:hypothetical protein
MKWFKHDSDAFADAKVKKLLLRHGPIGYAVYFHCLELINSGLEENNLDCELEHDSEIIADNLKIKGTADRSAESLVEEILSTMTDLKLIQKWNDKIYCQALFKRLDSSMTSNKELRNSIKQKKFKEAHSDISHDSVMKEESRVEDNRTAREGDRRIDESSTPEVKLLNEFYKRLENFCGERYPPNSQDLWNMKMILYMNNEQKVIDAMNIYFDPNFEFDFAQASTKPSNFRSVSQFTDNIVHLDIPVQTCHRFWLKTAG